MVDKMIKNIEKLAKLGKEKLEEQLTDTFSQLQNCIIYPARFVEEEIEELKNYFEKVTNVIKEKYGLEFPEIQGEYKTLILPRINKRLGVKT